MAAFDWSFGFESGNCLGTRPAAETILDYDPYAKMNIYLTPHCRSLESYFYREKTPRRPILARASVRSIHPTA